MTYRVGHVCALSPGGSGVGDHALQHLRGRHHGLAGQVAPTQHTTQHNMEKSRVQYSTQLRGEAMA